MNFAADEVVQFEVEVCTGRVPVRIRRRGWVVSQDEDSVWVMATEGLYRVKAERVSHVAHNRPQHP